MTEAKLREVLGAAIKAAILEMGLEAFKTTSLFPLSNRKAAAAQKLAA